MSRNRDTFLGDPDVVDPPDFDCAAAWAECRRYVERCGGLAHDDGEPNWTAAFGADPGCCSCPACRASYWRWGRVVRCRACGFEFPTSAWIDYAEGARAENYRKRGWLDEAKHARRMAASLYYRHAAEHPPEDAWNEFHRTDWRSVTTIGPNPTSEGHTP